jgi:hypothetical protein
MGSGVGQLGSEAGRSAVYSALPTGTLPATGMSLAAGALEPKNNVPGEEEYKRKYPELTLSENFRGYTPERPNPYYTPRGLGYGGYAEGGTVGFQDMPNGGLAALQGMRDGYAPTTTAAGDIAQFQAGGDVKKKKATRTAAAAHAAGAAHARSRAA